jgi:transcriptional regulator with XRE-family HTH domain
MSIEHTDPEPSTSPSTLGERLREKRLKKGLSISRLADAVEVSKGYIHDLEADKIARPSAEVLYRIALTLGTTIGFLLGKPKNPLIDEENQDIPNIPASLEQFAKEDRIPEEDKRRLACIKYRGRQPESVDDWRYLYETIKRVVPEGS